MTMEENRKVTTRHLSRNAYLYVRQSTLRQVLERTGYRKALETDGTPESESRLGNLEELLSAAAEAAEHGDSLQDFLDHSALVSDADSVDEQAQVSLLTMHNAKGLEFPVVFIAGMEEGLFPHSRSRDNDEQLEEERRLCYVAMTRAMKRLYLSSALSRRKYGGAPPEPSQPSRFLDEVPRHLVEELHSARQAPGSLDLYGERHAVREAARRNTYTGKTYNSLDHISQFFAARGIQTPAMMPQPKPPAPPPAVKTAPVTAAAPKPVARRTGLRSGNVVVHPKYGRGTIVRKEGDGDDAKLTISFPGHGLKKLIAKFAGLRAED